jgi:Calcineurin-like phosphoesterase
MRQLALFAPRWRAALVGVLAISSSLGAPAHVASGKPSSWQFAVAGDSRNCGDVVMPSIAEGAKANHAAFYWHLGDLRAIYDFDQDFKVLYPNASISEYLNGAWPEFERDQIEPFGDVPFFLGIGNHETIGPKTREEFVGTFADWLDMPAIREQRLKDDVHDHRVRTYYHWMRDGIDFIYLDNATPDQLDGAQMKWLAGVLERDQKETKARGVVVGMHEALPDSIAHGHSMNDFPVAEASGRRVYGMLLELNKSKPVYVLASHSHFVMEGIFDTAYWREHGGVLPGWIVGTAGAYRYALPAGWEQAKSARTHVYGYLLATVAAPGVRDRDPIQFEFKEVVEGTVPDSIVLRFGREFVHGCYAENAQQ